MADRKYFFAGPREDGQHFFWFGEATSEDANVAADRIGYGHRWPQSTVSG